MSNGLTLDGLPSMTELPTMFHEVLCQGRHILLLEDVPHSAGSTIPVIAASAPSLLSSSNTISRGSSRVLPRSIKTKATASNMQLGWYLLVKTMMGHEQQHWLGDFLRNEQQAGRSCDMSAKPGSGKPWSQIGIRSREETAA